MMKKAAVVGFGFAGSVHCINILKSEKLQLRAIVDKNPVDFTQSVGNFSVGQIDPEDFKNVTVYTTLEESLEKEQLDVIHICVPTAVHYAIAKKALENGKHVLVEKPICLDTAEAVELIDIAKKNSLILMAAHVVRFMQPYQLLKQWILEEKYGKLEFFRFSRYSGVPAWGEWKNKKIRSSSGGALFDFLIHDIDFVQSVLGKPSSIESFTLPGQLSEYDYINARWTFEDIGVTGIIEGGNFFHSNFPFECRYIAKFSNASVEYCSKKPDTITVAGNDGLEEVAAEDLNNGFLNEIDYFADCVTMNQWPQLCTPESALQAVELCKQHIR